MGFREQTAAQSAKEAVVKPALMEMCLSAALSSLQTVTSKAVIISSTTAKNTLTKCCLSQNQQHFLWNTSVLCFCHCRVTMTAAALSHAVLSAGNVLRGGWARANREFLCAAGNCRHHSPAGALPGNSLHSPWLGERTSDCFASVLAANPITSNRISS